MKMRDENQVLLSGDIPAGFVFSHEEYGGTKMYEGRITIFRKSTSYDILPIIVPEHMISRETELIASVYGEMRSRTVREDGKKSLTAYVRAMDIQYEVYLTGYLIKKPTIKMIGVKNDRKLARILLAVNRKKKAGYTRSDAISCLCWEENADAVENLKKGAKIKLRGRFQSRELWSDQSQSWVTALEVSVKRLEVL